MVIGSSGGFNVVNLAFARDAATIEEVLACDISPDCVTPGITTGLSSIFCQYCFKTNNNIRWFRVGS